jgi:23S rRNA pseudouridine1911/1915/1917 synthase
MSEIHLHGVINEALDGLRLDQALARLFPQYSRSQIKVWIEKGEARLNNNIITKCKERVSLGQEIELRAILENIDQWQAEYIPLDIVYQDNSLLVINKPPGLVVHPGAGNPKSTLINALLHYDPDLAIVPRVGLIHRLDKDTSGLLLIARTLEAHHFLTKQMQTRHIHRLYEAIVIGHPKRSGTIDLPIGRHPRQRTKMAVLPQGGKPACTHYKVIEQLAVHSYLEIELETGRTHQIRVHMAHIHHPILGDPLYSRSRHYSIFNEEIHHLLQAFKRQALHAKKIIFTHPATGNTCFFEAPRPLDFEMLLKKLREFS